MSRLPVLSLLLLWLVVLGCSRSRPVPAEAVSDTAPANKHSDPTPGVGDFDRFVLTADEAPCPTQAKGDCHSFLELLSDGTLRMDAWGEPGAAVLEVHVSADAVRSAAAVVQAKPLLDLLGRAKACADANPTETMLVRISGTEHRNETGYCNDSTIQSARAAALQLAGTHLRGHSLISPPF